MPFLEFMSWDKSKKRWHRMHQGVMYRVPASRLGPVPTRDATRQAANDWWQKKEAELNGHNRKSEPDPQVVGLLGEIDDPHMTAMVEAFIETTPAGKAESNDRSIKACGQSFLDVARGDMKPRSYEELKAYIDRLNKVSGLLAGEADVGRIDEDFVEKMYLQLRDSPVSSGRKKKHWGFFRRFVKYLWERRLIEIPRNLASHKFEVRAKKIKTYSVEEVQLVLKSLKSRLKLYAMLALNTGMTQVDMSELNKDQVDLKKATLTRKRVKTGDNDNVPTVTYRLWPQTVKLLRKHQSSHPELFLTNIRCNALVETRFEGGEVRRKDMIVQQWRRAKVPIPLKAFRSIAATLIESHEIYGRCTSYFLGHSPKSIKDRHYAAPPQQLFDQALDWLGEHLLS